MSLSTWKTPFYTYNGLEGLSQWKDTEAFCEAGLRFKKDKVYTTFPKGTSGYREYWDKEKEKIMNGMWSDGQYITNLHYTYLNYCPIPIQGSKNAIDFPNFWDLDADWFKQIKNAKDLKKYLAALKARRRGFSLKDMVPIIHNMIFERTTMNYLASYLDAHANKSMSFVKRYLNHFNKFTDFKRTYSPRTNDHIKTAFLDDRGIERGRLNELYKVLLKDNPTKGVGGNSDLFIYEEAGIVPGTQLLDTLEYVKAATEDGDIINGLIILYGSVGELEKCQSLKSIFLKPEENGFLSFDNIWGDDSIGDNKCGYFVPEYMCMKPYIDSNGNSLIDEALERIIKKREEKKKLSTKQYTIYITQHPIKPSEAFLSTDKSKFPVDLLTKWLLHLESTGEYKYGYGIKLHNDRGVIKPEIIFDVNQPFSEYPVKSDKQEGSEGIAWIYEPPITANKTENLYLQSTDSVDQETAPTSDSLFATYIFKNDPGTLSLSNDNSVPKHYFKNEIVASFIGRRDRIDECYDICMYLNEYYPGCKNLIENNNIGIKTHYLANKKDYLLQDQMDEIKGINPGSRVVREKGYHPTAEVINNKINLAVKYCLEVIGYEYNEDGTIKNEILGYTRIKDIGLIKEMIEYNGEKNTDRLDAFSGVLLYKQALSQREVRTQDSKNDPIVQAAQFAERMMGNMRQKAWNNTMQQVQQQRKVY